MIYIYQIPWDEMNVNDELTLYCRDNFCRQIENGLRQRVYQWDHTRGEMVMEPIMHMEPILHGDGFGITVKQRSIQSAPDASLHSREFIPQIESEDDVAGDSLVYSSKPNPAYLAVDTWNSGTVRKELHDILEITSANGCHVELILKDISTVRRQPYRLWEWAEVASEVASEFTR